MNDRFFTALFCDDVRHEMGNKLTLVGCYSGQLILPTIPSILPKLCVHITAATPRNNLFKQLTILVYKDDQELARLEVPSDDLAKISERVPGDDGRVGITSVLAFSPIQFEKPCKLSVRAITEEGEFKGPFLLITQQPTPSTKKSGKPAKIAAPKKVPAKAVAPKKVPAKTTAPKKAPA